MAMDTTTSPTDEDGDVVVCQGPSPDLFSFLQFCVKYTVEDYEHNTCTCTHLYCM